MKKLFSIIMALLMLCSVAFADQQVANKGEAPEVEAINAMPVDAGKEDTAQKEDTIHNEEKANDAEAPGEPQLISAGPGEGKMETEQEEKKDGSGDQEMAQTQAKEQNQAKDGSGEKESGEANRKKIQEGLSNALTKVSNENAREKIQTNLNRWMEKYQVRMEKMEGVEIEETDEESGSVTVKAKEQVKWFGIIKGTATKRFEIDGKGNVNEKAPWYSFMYGKAS